MTTSTDALDLEPPAPAASRHEPHGASWRLTLGAIGVVYGDIGTSPLYAIKECFSTESQHPVAVTQANVLGVLSLVVWSMIGVIVVKYLTFVLRADNAGSGGIMSLLALIPPRAGKVGHMGRAGVVVPLALFGTALLYGDGVITPAISVLSAVEGLGVATHALDAAILPITLGILTGLFWIQKRGTGGIGRLFGPITLVWFAMIAALGAPALLAHPGTLRAVDPRFAIGFLIEHGRSGFLLLGSVFLVVTGGEALYADMGHFGRGPIRRGWYLVVFPALLLNYFGQGASLLAHPETASNPFFGMVPAWGTLGVVAIATAATVVASQALISGAFSLTQQAMQLGYFPRVRVVHTSRDTEGQIYIPEINWGLWFGCIVCVLLFRTSSNLAAAYGIAVTGTMAITTVLFALVARRRWGWSLTVIVPLVALFMTFDTAFLVANATKILDGGWFPLGGGLVLFVVMTTWKRGREVLAESLRANVQPLAAFLAQVKCDAPTRVPGTAVFMASNPAGTPPILRHHHEHNQVLHAQVLLLSVRTSHVPYRTPSERVKVESLGSGFRRVTLSFGFMQTPDVPAALQLAADQGLLGFDPARTSYYLGRETLLLDSTRSLSRWRKWVFAVTSRNAVPATAHFGLPPGRVVEIGMQIDL